MPRAALLLPLLLLGGAAVAQPALVPDSAGAAAPLAVGDRLLVFQRAGSLQVEAPDGRHALPDVGPRALGGLVRVVETPHARVGHDWRIYFASDQPLAEGDENRRDDAYSYNAARGLRWRSPSAEGRDFDKGCAATDLSADGRFVALRCGFPPAQPEPRIWFDHAECWLHDAATGETRFVSEVLRAGEGFANGDGPCEDMVISDDGAAALLISRARGHGVGEAEDGAPRVYRIELGTGAATQLGVAPAQGAWLALSADGRTAAYLDAERALWTHGPAGAERVAEAVEGASMDASGRRVAFAAAPGDERPDIFLWRPDAPAISLSPADGCAEDTGVHTAPRISRDGLVVVFESSGQCLDAAPGAPLYAWREGLGLQALGLAPDGDRPDGELRAWALAPGGERVAFVSTATHLVPHDDAPGSAHLYVAATVSDADGDDTTLSAAWTGPAGEELIGEVLTSINTAAGETWTVTLTARDGYDTGAALTAEITIGNTPPDAPTVVIAPDPAREDAPLSCEVTDLDELDPDAQDLTVAWSWTVDGDDAGVTTDTVTPDLIAAGEVWTCTAIVSDGEDDSGATSASATVVAALDAPASLNLEEATVIEGTNGSQFTGDALTVGSPGDIDGDGLAEFVVTVNDEVCDVFCDGSATAYLFAGADPVGDSLDDAAAAFIGPVGFRLYAPWPLGDVNGDGIDDLVLPHRSVTSPTAEGGSAVFVIFGTEDGFSGDVVLDDLTEAGAGARIKNVENETMGTVACPLGDLDGDGFADLGLAAPDADLGTGRLYVVYGHPGTWLSGLTVADLVPGFRISGAGAGQTMGQACAGPIDVDRNGYDDVVVSATGGGEAGQGRALVYLMDDERLSGEFTSANADVIIDGDPGSIGGFGAGLASLGDHDGDGVPDFAIAEFGPELTNPEPPPNNFQAGTVHVVSPGPDGLPATVTYGDLPHTIVGDGDLGFCGRPAGVDLDGDGLGDLVCGDTRPQKAEGLGGAAQVRVFLGGDDLAVERGYDDADLVLNSAVHDHLAGLSLAGLPDRDGDGYDELLVGAPGRDGPLTDSGAVYLIDLAD